MSQTTLEICTPQCVAEEFDGEMVILNMDTGTYFSVKQSGARLWSDLSAGHAVETLVEKAGAGTPLANAIQEFASMSQSEGLMRVSENAPSPDGEPSFDFAATGESDMPVLEAYHDMQSLLLLDPVHEVDEEEGWPKLPD